jgi:alkyl hydroperoxide reductase subunit AhpC
MGLHIGSIAPDFEAETTDGNIKFHEWAGKSWVVLFSHPADFTPVCTTELGAVARLKDDLARRSAKPIALSVDPIESHRSWVKDIEETQDIALNYPIIADPDKKVSRAYDMVHDECDPKITVRSVYFIDPNKKIRASITYPPSAGRNFAEVLRLLDSLQLTDNHSVATPANWKDGDDVVIVPSLTDPEVIKQKFPKGFKQLKPYLRMTPQPNK